MTHPCSTRYLNRGRCDNSVVLVISCGRRFELLEKTLSSLFRYNKDFDKNIKKCWILDDRSSPHQRLEMDLLAKKYFGDNYNTICLNSDQKYYYINKLNLIRKISDIQDVVFYLEDDWECISTIQTERYLDLLNKMDVHSICLTGARSIQTESVSARVEKHEGFWKNPWPDTYRHITHCIGLNYHWCEVRWRNWSLNPNFSKASIYHRGHFEHVHNYEALFADTYGDDINQLFTNDPCFLHIGNENSLEN